MILIAGSTGIIGSYLVNELKTIGYKIIGMGNQELDMDNYHCVDLTNIVETEKVVEKIERPTLLVFLVALAHEKGARKDYEQFEKINFQTLKNLLSSLEEQNKLPRKIVFSSTISVYGEQFNITEYREESDLKPRSPYAVTKKMAEKFLLTKYHDRTTILRFAPVYSKSLLLNINRRVKINSLFYKVGGGNQKLSLLNIRNIPVVIEKIFEDRLPPGIYNLADDRIYSYSDMLKHFGTSSSIRIPRIIFMTLFLFAKITGNYRLKENTIKLLTDNIYPVDKIKKVIDIPYTIDEIA